MMNRIFQPSMFYTKRPTSLKSEMLIPKDIGYVFMKKTVVDYNIAIMLSPEDSKMPSSEDSNNYICCYLQ